MTVIFWKFCKGNKKIFTFTKSNTASGVRIELEKITLEIYIRLLILNYLKCPAQVKNGH